MNYLDSEWIVQLAIWACIIFCIREYTTSTDWQWILFIKVSKANYLGHSTNKQRMYLYECDCDWCTRICSCSFAITNQPSVSCHTAQFNALDVKWPVDSLIFNMIHLIEFNGAQMEFPNATHIWCSHPCGSVYNVYTNLIAITIKYAYGRWLMKFGQVSYMQIFSSRLKIKINTLIQLHGIKST